MTILAPLEGATAVVVTAPNDRARFRVHNAAGAAQLMRALLLPAGYRAAVIDSRGRELVHRIGPDPLMRRRVRR